MFIPVQIAKKKGRIGIKAEIRSINSDIVFITKRNRNKKIGFHFFLDS
jgi:hypothetical protein